MTTIESSEGTAGITRHPEAGPVSPRAVPPAGEAIETTTGVRSADEVLAWSRNMIEATLRPVVDTLPASARHIAGYHFGWWDEQGRPSAPGGGKALRPALALLAAEAVGGAATLALRPAGAVELVHDFSLLHDDVMDGDRTRRHRPTAWAVFGVSPAILAGDALLTLAFDVLATGGHPITAEATRLFGIAVQELLEGQSADVAFEGRHDVGPAECLGMAAGKTGALLGCACELGALFGGGGPEQAEHLGAFGRDLGLAFQLVDDLLGIWGDPEATGKPVYSDLRSRKKSIPVVAALASGTAAGRELAGIYHREQPLSDTELVRAAELVEAAGGRSWTQLEADELLARALRHLRAAGAQPRPAAELTALARLVTRRDH